MPKSPLFSRVQPGGVFTITDESQTTGEIFFVHSGTGTDSAGYGRNPDSPVATIDYAVGLCTASKGDRIYVMPGHAETLDAATDLVVDVAGVSIIGLGHGTLKPVLTYGATDAILSITAANCLVKNLRLLGNIDNIVNAITLGASADGAVLDGIEIVDGASNKEFLTGITITAACHDVTIQNCKTFGLGGGATTAVLNAGASDRLIFRNNIIQGTFSTALMDISGAASANMSIHDNYLMNRDTAAGLVIKGHATNTGFAVRNWLLGAKNNTETFNTPGTLHVAENYGTDVAAASGILTPSTLTAWA